MAKSLIIFSFQFLQNLSSFLFIIFHSLSHHFLLDQLLYLIFSYYYYRLTSSIPVSITFPSPKTYTVTLTVTDDKGATGKSSQSIVVKNPPKNFHIESLSKAVVKVGSSFFGKLTVKVFDNTGKPVQSVVVSGQISHPPSNLWDNVSGTTNSNGIAILQNSTPRTSLPYVNACAYSFQYTGSLGLWYNSGDNKVTNTCI